VQESSVSLIRVFVSLFAKREWGLGRSPNKQTSRKKRKKAFCAICTDERLQKASGGQSEALQ
jgi:hypothetical protein